MGKDKQLAILGGNEDPVNLLAGIGVTKYPVRWEPLLARETQLAKQEGCPAVEEGFLQELNARYHLPAAHLNYRLQRGNPIFGRPRFAI